MSESSIYTIFDRSPSVCGVGADRILGYKNAEIFGAVLMTIGHNILGFCGVSKLYLFMSLLSCGFVFFYSTVSFLLGQTYIFFE
ncbi:MFS transporter [Francisella tularensis]|nr:hypothetical protein [Francisella tularensis]